MNVRIVRLMCVGVLLAGALGSAPGAAAAPGPQIKVRARATAHWYANPMHKIRGKVVIQNRSDRAKTIKCTVVVLLKGEDVKRRGRAPVRARVGADSTRSPRWSMEIRDEAHELPNIPTSVKAHCRQV